MCISLSILETEVKTSKIRNGKSKPNKHHHCGKYVNNVCCMMTGDQILTHGVEHLETSTSPV